MCVHRRFVVWLCEVECACTDDVLCGCGQLNVRAQTVFCVAVGSSMCVYRLCVVWLWAVEFACTDVVCVAVGS